MGYADQVYDQMVLKIHNEGIWDHEQQVRTRWMDGTPAHTKSILFQQIRFDNQEVPILTKKKVNARAAILEMLWIWQKKTSDVNVLNEMGVHIWDPWKREDGTIGKAYGYQLGKPCRKVKWNDALYKMLEQGELRPNQTIEFIDGIYLDQVDYLIYQLKTNPASRRLVTSLWDVEELDDMALEPCVWSTQWIVKDNKLNLYVQIR